jgi:1-acyl-sn-glycerol-3-phosphate acyltransferase
VPRRIEKSGFWVWVTAMIFYPLASFGKVVSSGAEQIRREGGVLLVMNHVSHIDPPIDAVFVHRNGRVPRFLAKESLFRMPVFKYMIRGAGSIPVYRRTTGASDSLSAAGAALRDGKLVVIYPEGTITKDPDGWPMRSRTGAARLALENDVPVLTAARWGTNHILDGYAKKFRPFPRKKVRIDVSEPIDLSAHRGKPITNELLREVTELLMGRVKEQLATIREEQAPDGFFLPSKAARKKDRDQDTDQDTARDAKKDAEKDTAVDDV